MSVYNVHLLSFPSIMHLGNIVVIKNGSNVAYDQMMCNDQSQNLMPIQHACIAPSTFSSCICKVFVSDTQILNEGP